MHRAVYPGSFNPVHLGHMHVILQASQIFDEVRVLIAVNPEKTYKVSAEDRKRLIESLLGTLPCHNVSVDISDRPLVEYYDRNGMDAVVRGIRDGNDLQYECAQREYNLRLQQPLNLRRNKTPLTYVFFAPNPKFQHLSSTYVRQFIQYCTPAQLVDLYERELHGTPAETLYNLYKE